MVAVGNVMFICGDMVVHLCDRFLHVVVHWWRCGILGWRCDGSLVDIMQWLIGGTCVGSLVEM